ncbi:hypothetical protein H7171_01020 [Candidatus Saccharibacteria bacterium]|nr:hypothetical protein [Candidatus Saccharibacteria bacterium]
MADYIFESIPPLSPPSFEEKEKLEQMMQIGITVRKDMEQLIAEPLIQTGPVRSLVAVEFIPVGSGRPLEPQPSEEGDTEAVSLNKQKSVASAVITERLLKMYVARNGPNKSDPLSFVVYEVATVHREGSKRRFRGAKRDETVNSRHKTIGIVCSNNRMISPILYEPFTLDQEQKRLEFVQSKLTLMKNQKHLADAVKKEGGIQYDSISELLADGA